MKVLPTMGSAYSGSLRGITAGHNKGGLYFRGRTVPTNPATALQSQVRAAFANLSQVWSTQLTAMQRAGWETYAQNVSWIDSLGQTIQLSGINHFVRSNTPRIQGAMVLGTTLPRIDDAPTLFEIGVTPEILNPNITHAAGPPVTVDAQVTLSNVGDYGGDDVILYWLSGPQNAGIKFFSGPYVLSGVDDPPGALHDTAMYDATPTPLPWSDRWGVPAEGQRIFGYARALHEDGRLSSKAKLDFGLIPAAS